MPSSAGSNLTIDHVSHFAGQGSGAKPSVERNPMPGRDVLAQHPDRSNHHAEHHGSRRGALHLPLYRDAFAEHHRIIGVWDTDGDAAERAAADLGVTAAAAWPTVSRRSRTWPTSSACTPKCQTFAVNLLPRRSLSSWRSRARRRSPASPRSATRPTRRACRRRSRSCSGTARCRTCWSRRGSAPSRFSFVAGPPDRGMSTPAVLGPRPIDIRGRMPVPARRAFHRHAAPPHRRADHRSPVGAPVPRRRRH